MITEESTNDHEILSPDEQKVRELCLSLKKVDAPKDFDFKLKARIANTNSNAFQPRFGLAFRYALPALAMIFALSFLAYTSGIFSSNNVPVIADGSPEKTNSSLPQNTMASTFPTTTENENTNENLAVSNLSQNLPKIPENEIAENNPQKPKPEKKREGKNDNFNGSELKSVKPPEIVVPNFSSNVIPQKPQNVEKVTSLPVKEILAQFGINAAFENGKWIVKSVVQNGVGESSGIRENDIVEAIDNQTVSNEPVSAKTLNVKNITVTRGGGKLEIKLRNKQ